LATAVLAQMAARLGHFSPGRRWNTQQTLWLLIGSWDKVILGMIATRAARRKLPARRRGGRAEQSALQDEERCAMKNGAG
jgi:hypothetical protein